MIADASGEALREAASESGVERAIPQTATRDALELWGGVECTCNRVGDRWFDQLSWSGHEARLDDLDCFAALGIRTLRYPLLWERQAPRNLDDIDWTWADERMARLGALGLRPIVGLIHHGSGPRYTSLLDPQFGEKLACYAGAIARRYPWVTHFTPVNEPLTTARFSGLYGLWYPHARSDAGFVRMLLNQLRGVSLAMQAIRDVIPAARLVQTEDCGASFGHGATRLQVAHENHRRWLTWDLLTGRVNDRHPLHGYLVRAGMERADEDFFLKTPCPPDVLGLNYYVTSDRYLDDRLDLYPAEQHGGNGLVRYADVEAVRARPEGIAGHGAHLLAAWTRYGIPVAVTEAHLGCTREEQLRWLAESWASADRARASGVDVRAVTAWALLGSYNWDSLVTRDAEHYEPGAFDVRSGTPRPTALADALSTLARGGPLRHPALAGRPWWRCEEGLFHQAIQEHPSDSRAAPVLIIGSTGTLGRAFQRLCAVRGLASEIAGRQEVDITDPRSVDAILRRSRPWAVINAAGYVRVDDAELEPDLCRSANVAGPMNLAAACRRRGLKLVTFSSDLVFDGTAGRAYVEQDEVRPLNVYGESKAEAERRVLAILSDTLVIRTSAFFSPWDDSNFLAGLFRALDSGSRFLAPEDTVVSPTYVPDLVHATLDLLVDGEQGIWHLANQGAVTWFDFARSAAARSGRVADLIVPIGAETIWGPAARPRNSALSSTRGQLLQPLTSALDDYLLATPHMKAQAKDPGRASR